jgi:hypothetical protein
MSELWDVNNMLNNSRNILYLKFEFLKLGRINKWEFQSVEWNQRDALFIKFIRN